MKTFYKTFLSFIFIILVFNNNIYGESSPPMQGYFVDVLVLTFDFNGHADNSKDDHYVEYSSEKVQNTVNDALGRLEKVYSNTHTFKVEIDTDIIVIKRLSYECYIVNTITIHCYPK